jgi:hypothetical protein
LLLYGFENDFPNTARKIGRAASLQTRKTIAPPPLTTAWQTRADRGLNARIMRGSGFVCAGAAR